jgi:membrane protease YdiL (CAAX protease family)
MSMEWLQNTQTDNSKWWSWWLGLVVIVVCYVIIGWIPVVVGRNAGLIVFDGSGSLMGGSNSPVQFARLMFSPIMLFVGVWLAQRIVHRRSLSELLSAGSFRWPFVWQSMAMWLMIGAVSTLIELLVYPDRYVWSFDRGSWLTIAPVVLLLIPIQAAGEELFFRAYLMQSVARLWAQPLFLC